MAANNRKKSEQLGMAHGTAANKLRKQIMFSLLKELDRTKCYQCGGQIETPDELSIEHRKPWIDSNDPVKLFFDLDNVAFSHFRCNSGAARRHKGPEAEHGTRTRYDKWGCRCPDCKAAKAEDKAWIKEKEFM